MSMQQDFASIILPAEYLPDWFHLRNEDNPLVRLHSKFWGKSLTCEEPEPSRNHINSVDKDEGMDSDAVDDDFISGCAILNIGIENLPFQKIWIRADYIRVYNFLKNWEGPQVTNNVAPGAVLTGQPGIGKSVWVYYALCRRLVERKPVIWYHDHSCFLFLKEGVFRAPAEFPSSHFRTIVWTLVDSDECQKGAPSRLLTPGTRLYVIYITSPCAQPWPQMTKTVRDIRIIMNPWRRREIDNAASAYHGCDREQINRLFDRLGPTPRLSLDFNLYGLRTHEDDLRETLRSLTPVALEKLFDDASTLEMGKISHKIFLISRETLEDVTSRPTVKPITLYVRSKLVCQLRTLQLFEQRRLYQRLAASYSRDLVGIAFEAACQSRLRYGSALVLDPISMAHHLPNTPQPPWYLRHILPHKRLEQCRQTTLKNRVSVYPSRTFEYSDRDRLSIKPNALYLPAMSNQVAFDAFILLNGILSIFQFSIGCHHVVKPGLRDFFAMCSDIPPMKNWQSVLIIPSKQTLVCPQQAPAIPLYSAVMRF